ncbi:DNA-binding transcriptional regulator, LysR family [Ferrimonas sediminum]|uniref:DNA-binding transcriptional regulator, LysR family n=1 Tax=Ferrimonas sediminum TaxID=718193 RepID=A0A1G8JE15_9GAMM|nr:LysR family transcriptional regulator [Ferrimonas sediminum]SDI29445.1 DNA-binding transcriptional regulator, LysR family [Ferrimonas sediminum]
MKNKLLHLDLLTLSVFVKLVEEKHGLTVARQLGLSQSKVSRCVKQLKEAFKDELFHRSGDGLIPSSVAMDLYEHAKIIVSQQLTMQDKINTSSCKSLHLKVLANEHFYNAFMKATEEVSRKQKINLSVEFLSWDQDSTSKVSQREVDIEICPGPRDSSSIVSFPFATSVEPFFIVARSNHPIFTRPFTMKRLFEYPFVLTRHPKEEKSKNNLGMYIQKNNLSIVSCSISPSIKFTMDRVKSSDAIGLFGNLFAYQECQNIEGVQALDITDTFVPIAWPNPSDKPESISLHCRKAGPVALTEALSLSLMKQFQTMQREYWGPNPENRRQVNRNLQTPPKLGVIPN